MIPLELNLKSMADIATSLFANHLRFDAGDPNWPDRDRVIFSNGHASMLHYALLHLTGYEAMTLDQLKAFRQWGSLTPGHPESDHTPGIEVTTGPLGQGFGMSVGMAIAEACLRDEFGSSLCDHRTWVFAGDGCLMEGIGQEAASLAGHLGLGRINLLYDDNGITIDGKTKLSFTENTAQKFDALGWHIVRADGHDFVSIDNALRAAAQTVDRPSIIICKTEIGFGSPKMAGSHKVHGAPLGPEEVVATKVNLGLSTQPFNVDREVQELWREVGKKGAKERANWQAKLDGSDPERRASFVDRQAGKLPQNLAASISIFKSELLKNPVSAATRKSSQSVLEMLTTALPAMIGGSADLTHSNLTQTSSTEEAFTRIVADTGELAAVQRLRPVDCTTNPSLVLAALKDPASEELVSKELAACRIADKGAEDAAATLTVAIGAELSKLVPGRVSTEVDACLSFDTEASVRRATEIIDDYATRGVGKERILIKLAATWEGIRAAEILQRDGIDCNLTLLFSLSQAVACADAGAFLISPFVGRITDWYKKADELLPICWTGSGVI